MQLTSIWTWVVSCRNAISTLETKSQTTRRINGTLWNEWGISWYPASVPQLAAFVGGTLRLDVIHNQCYNPQKTQPNHAGHQRESVTLWIAWIIWKGLCNWQHKALTMHEMFLFTMIVRDRLQWNLQRNSYIFSFKKIYLKMSSGKWRPLYLASMC